MTTIESRRQVLERLRVAQKSNRGAGGYSRWVNRPLGRQIAALAYLAGLTPNQVSLLSAAFTYSAIATVGSIGPSIGVSVGTCVLLLIGYATDSADGQVARLRGGGSMAGEWLDHVLDAAKLSALHLTVAICWFRFYDLHRRVTLLIPLGYAVVAAVFFFAIVLSDLLRRIARIREGGNDATTSMVDPYERAPVLQSVVVLGNDYGVLCLAFALLCLHSTFIIIYTVLFAANVCYLAAGCVRWWRELSYL